MGRGLGVPKEDTVLKVKSACPLVNNLLSAPVAYQVILEPGLGQYREFESPGDHTRINSWGLFLVHKLTRGKRESVS